MSILGVVLRTTPDLIDAVAQRLHGRPGVDVVCDNRDGRFVVVLEDTDEPGALTAAATLGEMATWPELHCTSLVYEYSGPDAPAPESPVPAYKAWRSDLGTLHRRSKPDAEPR